MAEAEAFFDSNVVLYLLSADTAKADRAEAVLAEGGVVSVQVLNEVAVVARRKNALDWDEIDDVLAIVRRVARVVPLTLAIHERGLAVARATGYRVYDAMIVAAAATAGCDRLYTEDMQAGRVIEGVTLVNPFD